jgi:probable phosphoglycerate mutase
VAASAYLIRHGETAWSLSGQHTGTTDLALTDRGAEAARRLGPALSQVTFASVLTSPMRRAVQTCELAGLAERAAVDRDLMEWNYGEYEGLTSLQIRERAPGWVLFRDGCPGGESPEAIGARVDRLIERLRSIDGNVALFAHGHVFRVLAARWLGLPVMIARHFLLDTATLSLLGYDRDVPAVKQWNMPVG